MGNFIFRAVHGVLIAKNNFFISSSYHTYPCTLKDIEVYSLFNRSSKINSNAKTPVPESLF